MGGRGRGTGTEEEDETVGGCSSERREAQENGGGESKGSRHTRGHFRNVDDMKLRLIEDE